MSSKTLEIIAEALVDGDVSLVKSSVQKAVEEGIIAKEILNEGLLAGILLIAANLRAPITGLAPVLAMIQADFGLGTVQAGILTTLPLLAFALLSPVAPLLARRIGLERALFAALVLIAGGVALRSAGPLGCLYGGTAVIGAGIALGNVLLPSLLKRDFPARIATVTSAYALTMGVAAAVASATVFPLATHLGWRGALAAIVVRIMAVS